MHSILSHNTYFIKEHVGIFKAANNYDVFDAETDEHLMECREKIGFSTKILRFTPFRRVTPFCSVAQTLGGDSLFIVRRGVTFWMSQIEVLDKNEQLVGAFRQRWSWLAFLSGWGCANVDVLNPQGQVICRIAPDFNVVQFRFVTKDSEDVAVITKQWAGLAQELFTSADNYMLSIAPNVDKKSPLRLLMLAAVLCIDFVFKEGTK